MKIPSSSGAIGAVALAAIALAACQRPVEEGLPYRIDANKDAQYSVDCRYPGYKVQGEFVNTTAFVQKGPATGVLPTDRPRCTLKKIAGPGPVTLSITKNGKVSTAQVSDPGQESKVFVL